MEQYDVCVIGAVGIPAFNSRFHELVNTLGITERAPFVVPEGNAASMRYLNRDGQWKISYNPLLATGSEQEMTSLKDTLGVTDADLEALGAFYAEILSLSDADINTLDDTGAYAWMDRFQLATPRVSQICMNLNTLFVVAVDRLPASEMIFALRDQVLGGAGRYHIGGYGRVAEVCADYVVEHGGLYLTKARVQRIVVECLVVAAQARIRRLIRVLMWRRWWKGIWREVNDEKRFWIADYFGPDVWHVAFIDTNRICRARRSALNRSR